MPAEPTLHLVCGKIAAGKSTRVATLGAEPDTIAVSEDAWLARLYPGEQNSLADYLRNAGRFRSAIAPHLVALLRAGLSVVLDFPASTLASRAWMRSIFEEAGTAHQLHWLDVPDEVCKARLHRRNASGSHEFTVSDEVFDLFTSHFVAPTPEEGFNLIVHHS
jgi:predicted kinase